MEVPPAFQVDNRHYYTVPFPSDGPRWTTWALDGRLPLEVTTPTETLTNLFFEGLHLGQLREGGAIEGVLPVLTDPRGSLLRIDKEALDSFRERVGGVSRG